MRDIGTWMKYFSKQGPYKTEGGRNRDCRRIGELNAYCEKHQLQKPIGNQLGYSLARVKADTGAHMDTRHMQPAPFIWHKKSQFPVYAFSSQASGLFAKCASFDELMTHEGLGAYKDSSNTKLFSADQEICAKKTVSPNQLALAALLHSPFPCFPIIGPRNDKQMQDSLAAATINLEEKEIAQLFSHWA